MNKVQALTAFWRGFGLKAYDETSVPDYTELPYITFETGTSYFGEQVALTASLWYRDTSWVNITLKEQEIAQAIGRGGIVVSYDDGAFWLRRGTPWAQRMSDAQDDMVRRIVLNYSIEYID